MALFAVAAVGFLRSHERTRDPLMFWFAIGATLAAFARLNYFLFPSQYSEYFYTGDVLRLGFFVALLIGGALEIRVAQRDLEHAAVINERRRLAREIHDGMAQDLAFIVQQASALAGRDGASPTMADIETAARRALAESRSAIAALVRPTGEPLDMALKRVAEEAAARWDAAVETRAVGGPRAGAPGARGAAADRGGGGDERGAPRARQEHPPRAGGAPGPPGARGRRRRGVRSGEARTAGAATGSRACATAPRRSAAGCR